MKKLTPVSFLAALIFAALIAMPLPKTDAQAGLVSSLLSRMQNSRENLKSLSADINMEKYNSQLHSRPVCYIRIKSAQPSILSISQFWNCSIEKY